MDNFITKVKKENNCRIHREEVFEETDGWFWKPNRKKSTRIFTVTLPCKNVNKVIRKGDRVERITNNDDDDDDE